ncbi:LAFE_0H05996g1_1 [Lachancea fermentati]|uniref:LAFE_0H05996g1_1 n=1 Tax=Lachancea fermentati TaxID=4955 RepID=A0A1G4MJQ1_LACFM|nr:LAFE_0H05996g1_1 [Lachancea fermentati]
MNKEANSQKSRRARSNSSSNGSSSPTPQEFMTPSTAPRNRYTHIIVLKSLNNTFETKFLVVPFKPDGLKLGRPVVNSGVQANGKQESQPQVRPDNGHFDSRVLSRNHASLSCDSSTGKIYIRDLKSSNGTFVNGNRISQSDVELKVGDVVDLGTDIDAKFEHRKISALVEDISVIPLIDDVEKLTNNSLDDHTNGLNGIGNAIVSTPNAQRAAFEAAMFGDVNNLDLEDSVLGAETEILSGIFINNSIGTSPNLINVIKTLVTEITLEKHEYEKLKSIENFFVQYTANIEYINKLRVENNDIQLVQLQNALKQKLTEKHDILMKDCAEQLNIAKKETLDLREACKVEREAQLEEIKGLKTEIEDLCTRLQVEKYKNAQLAKNSTNDESGSLAATAIEKKKDSNCNENVKEVSKKSKSTILLSALSIGVIAAAFQYTTKQ